MAPCYAAKACCGQPRAGAPCNRLVRVFLLGCTDFPCYPQHASYKANHRIPDGQPYPQAEHLSREALAVLIANHGTTGALRGGLLRQGCKRRRDALPPHTGRSRSLEQDIQAGLDLLAKKRSIAKQAAWEA